MRFWILLLLLSIKISGQNCSFSLSGKVTELATTQSMENVYVTINETNQKTVTNSLGEFRFENLCPGDYHITATHVGCEDCVTFCKVNQNRNIDVKLKHFSELLTETVIHGEETKSLQQTNTIDKKVIKENANKSFGDLLEKVQGVSSIKVGNSISKPVINGLVGTRVGFIDNGVPLASQLWGLDHAPEIDPNKSDHISVLKGVAALEYATTANALVIVDPFEIKKEPHLHGDFNYIFDTNSRAHTSNVSLTNYNKIIGFHLTGTFKKSGDGQAPDYFLTNTGAEQQNFSALLEKEISSKLKLSANYSYFGTTLGILAGALNETRADVERSLNGDVPLRTINEFSYDIIKPYQEVYHHLAKFEAVYNFSNISELKLEYAYQLNHRSEFDRRRGEDRSEIPVLELELRNHYFGSVYNTKFNDSDNFKAGLQYVQNRNKNIFGTGVFPLVPDYNSDEIGVFSSYNIEVNNWNFELGARLNFSNFNVTTAIGELENFKYDYTNYAFATGVSYRFNDSLKSTFNIGYATRGAKTNELFSFGRHQSVGAFEEGSYFADDKFLEEERNLKMTWSWDYNVGDQFFLQALFYVNPFENYIYLAAQKNPVTGEFVTFTEVARTADTPVYAYEQADALILGQDFNLVYSPFKRLKFNLKFAYLYGQNLDLDAPLIFMSPNNGSLTTSYTFNNGKNLKNSNISLEVKHTAKQNRFNINEELVAPPEDGFTLLNLSASTEIDIAKQKLEFGFNIDNLTNLAYRNYLNRLRYFSDEQGINFSFRLGYKF